MCVNLCAAHTATAPLEVRKLWTTFAQSNYRIKEGDRERIQVFQGDVIRMSGAGSRETFTVRKISFGVGVERTFPLHSPKIGKLEVVRHGDIRRAKLYYLRDRVGKAARIREKR